MTETKPHYIEDLTKEITRLCDRMDKSDDAIVSIKDSVQGLYIVQRDLVKELKVINDNNIKNEQATSPIIESYNTATTVGKWFMGICLFASVIISIILGLKSINVPRV